MSWDLEYWTSKDWEIVNDRLTKLLDRGVVVNPDIGYLDRALVDCPLDRTRVAIMSQDPYPDHRYATGVAFSIPKELGTKFPPTLSEIFREYYRDLHFNLPSHGDLSRWIEQGVLLWNVIPSCTDGVSLSHDWEEYESLTREIIYKLSTRGVVFVFLGSVARRYVDCVFGDNNRVIVASHPSPRASISARNPFRGSRIFSTINQRLNEIGLEAIDWRLDDSVAAMTSEMSNASISANNLSQPDLARSSVLENTTGAELPGLKRQEGPARYSTDFSAE